MLLWLITYLQSLGFHVPAAFTYTSTRAMMACLTTVFLGILLGPSLIRRLTKLHCQDVPRAAEEVPALASLHIKKAKTPTMGGLLIVGSILVSLLLFMDFRFCYGWLFLFVLITSAAAGFWDDLSKLRRKGIGERSKYLIFTAITLAIFAYLLFPTVQHFFPFEVPSAHLFLQKAGGGVTASMEDFQRSYFLPCVRYPIIFAGGVGLLIALATMLFVLVGSAQSANLTDGLDGLCAGAVLPPAAVLGVAAFLSGHLVLARGLNLPYLEGAGEVAIAMSALFGAALAFLWFNSYPAQIIMGDTGALAMGAMLGLAAILIRREWLLGLSAIIFVVEALSVIIQRFSYKHFNKKRIFLCAPLHYHFQMQKIHESKIVIRFWIIGWVFATIALATLKFQ